MSTSSVMSHMPVAGDNLQAKLDSALRENMQLKAFIRERYGVEAEAEANAVVAMGHLQ
ncbi:hypothetical protein BGX29_002309 [Mortierella sp. GBA35]|nr:hypothetical protein BGX29_002309 [Mortierella sp. GBA35]